MTPSPITWWNTKLAYRKPAWASPRRLPDGWTDQDTQRLRHRPRGRCPPDRSGGWGRPLGAGPRAADAGRGLAYGLTALLIVIVVMLVVAANASTLGTVGVVIGSVAVTTIAGFAFSWLRLRSHSLIAPIVAHWATKSVGLIVAWLVMR